MKCVHCTNLQEFERNKIPFRAICEKCGKDLHSCKNCKHYAPGKPNDCAIAGTLFVRDRDAYNFCEDFFPKDEVKPLASEKGKNAFDNLFK